MTRFGLFLTGLLLSSAAVAGNWKAMMSPGPIHTSHAEVEGDCDACHLVFDGIPDARCLACHEGLATRIAEERGYHATVDKPCIECHGDHHGADASLTKEEARSAFTHDLTGFTLEGAHDGVDCSECHKGPLDEHAASCADCHEDTHSSALGPECGLCHSPVSWKADLKVLSNHLLEMEGPHGEKACADCHTHGANLAGDVPCAACHDQAHGGSASNCSQCHEVTAFKPAQFDHGPCTCAFPGLHQSNECLGCHDDFVFTNTPTQCAGCHEADLKHDPLGACSRCHTALSWKENLFDHDKRSKFPIAGAHLEVSCSQCHTEEGVFGGLPMDCASCHKALGDQTHGDFGVCEDCHEVAGFSPSTFDHAVKGGFALTGRHAEIPCQECHAEKVERYPSEGRKGRPE